MSGYREAAAGTFIVTAVPFARRATRVGAVIGLFLLCLSGWLGLRTKTLVCTRTGGTAMRCGATEKTLFGVSREQAAFPASVSLGLTCIVGSCGLWVPSGPSDERISLPSNDEREAARVKEALEQWRQSGATEPYTYATTIDWARATGIVPGALILLAALVVGRWRTVVRLAGAPRMLTVERRRWPLRSRSADFAAGNVRTQIDPAPNGAWAWVVLVGANGERQKLFAGQHGPPLSDGVAALNDALGQIATGEIT